MTTPKRIKASLGFSRTTDANLLSRLNAVLDGLAGNSAYPTPIIDLATFKAGIDSYAASIAAALDGGTKAIAERNKQREAGIQNLEQLAHYVELNCKNDLATFTSSGFQVVSRTRTPVEPVVQPTIVKVDQGNSGQLVVTVEARRNALAYELRNAVLGAGGLLGPWTTVTLTSAKPASVDGLTPGSTYAFQVRALGKLGHTDWSDSVTRMCI